LRPEVQSEIAPFPQTVAHASQTALLLDYDGTLAPFETNRDQAWRGLSESGVNALRARVLLGWRPIAESSGLGLLDFDGGIEVRTPEADKSDVVRAFLGEIGRNTPAAYLGDDNTDESAFQAMQGPGLSVLVRPTWRQTAAQIWLQPHGLLLGFLGLWLKACTEGRTFDSGVAATVNG